MFSADFISGSSHFTQHLTSGELILIHSADASILENNYTKNIKMNHFVKAVQLYKQTQKSLIDFPGIYQQHKF